MNDNINITDMEVPSEKGCVFFVDSCLAMPLEVHIIATLNSLDIFGPDHWATQLARASLVDRLDRICNGSVFN